MRSRALICTLVTGVALLLASGCGSSRQGAAAPPKPGTLAYDWYAAGEAWKTGDYSRCLNHLSRVAVAQSEYRDQARVQLLLVAGGLADGYAELANAYEASARGNLEFRRQMNEVRKAADTAAMQFAETLHDMIGKDRNAAIAFSGFAYPAGASSIPLQMVKIQKGLAMQAADHEVVRQKMAQRGVTRFAAALAGSPEDQEMARTTLAAAPREVVMPAMAKQLIQVAEIYGPKKLDVPARGNALAKEALEVVQNLPDSVREKKPLQKSANEALKKYKVQT